MTDRRSDADIDDDEPADRVTVDQVLARLRDEVFPNWNDFRDAATPVTQADALLAVANALFHLETDVSDLDAGVQRRVWALWDAGELRSLHATDASAQTERLRLLDRELASASTERDIELIRRQVNVTPIAVSP